MGTRYYITVVCSGCGHTDNDVYYAPTCGFTTHTCPECRTITDLEAYTGISEAEASNLAEIQDIVDEVKEGLDA